MVYQIVSPKAGHVRALFELPASLWAQSVYVVGDFDEKGPVMLRMRQERDALWRGIIDLPIGRRYEFRYLIDGRWCCDSHANSSADHIVAGEIGDPPKSVIDTCAYEERVLENPAPVAKRMGEVMEIQRQTSVNGAHYSHVKACHD